MHKGLTAINFEYFEKRFAFHLGSAARLSMIMHLLLFFFITFSMTPAYSTFDADDEWIFPLDLQPSESDLLWDNSDTGLDLAIDQTGFETSSTANIQFLDEESDTAYLNPDDDPFLPITPDDEWPTLGLGSSCSMNEGLMLGKVRRGDQCSVKEENPPSAPASGPIAPGLDKEGDSAPTDRSSNNELEPQPLSSSLFGVQFRDLCPQYKVPGKEPLCCQDRPFGFFVKNCINCENLT